MVLEMVGRLAEMMEVMKDALMNLAFHLAEMLANLIWKDFWRADCLEQQTSKVGMRAGHLAEMMAET